MRMTSYRRRRRIFNILRYSGIGVGLIICLFPIYEMVSTSLKNPVDAFSIPPKWFFRPVFENYAAVLTENNFLRYFFNSVFQALATTLLSVSAGALAAYSLARRVFRGKRIFAGTTFILRMIPPVVLVVPVFIMFRNLGITDSLFGLILVYTALTMPFGIWVTAAFIEEIPVSMEESAFIDGCGTWQTFTRIVFPLITPGLSAAAVFTFRTAWNEFILSLVLTNRVTRTLPVAVSLYITDAGTEWGKITAIASIIAIPAFFFTFFAARQLITGITVGAVKG